VVGHEAVDDDGNEQSLLDEIAREGARRMLVAALETEVAAYLEAHAAERDSAGHAPVVRNGKGRTRNVTVPARRPGIERRLARRAREHVRALQAARPRPENVARRVVHRDASCAAVLRTTVRTPFAKPTCSHRR
jgi:hypothetical protein